jgi:hypothetical protein
MHVAESPGPLNKRFTRTVEVDFDFDYGSLSPIKQEDDIDSANGDKNIEENNETEVEVGTEETREDSTDVQPAGTIEDDIVASSPESGKHVSPVEPHQAADDIAEPDSEVVYYTDVNPNVSDFLSMRKVDGVYIVPFKKPFVIQTPILKITELTKSSASLRVTKGFAKFVGEFEDSVLSATKKHKSEWFKDEIDDDTIENGLKSFLTDDGDLKVKVSEDLASFDEDGNFLGDGFDVPAGVRCILEVSGICFGSIEFGAIFTLSQMQVARLPKCAIKSFKEKTERSYSGEFA